MPIGIKNSTQVSCHLSCALLLLFHCLPELRDVLIELSTTRYTSSKLLEGVGSFFRELQTASEKEEEGEEEENEPLDPELVYRIIEETTQLSSHDTGDAAKAVRVLLGAVREQASKLNIGKDHLVGILSQYLEGTSRQDILGTKGSHQRIKSKPPRTMPNPYPLQSSESLLRSLQCSTSSQPIRGYNWGDASGYQEVQLEQDSGFTDWNTTIKTKITSLPQHLLMHLQRFRHSEGELRILHNQMDVPLVLPSKAFGLLGGVFRLTGAILYVSDCPKVDRDDAGHYVVLIQQKEPNQWCLFDDDHVQKLNHEDDEILNFLSGRQSMIEPDCEGSFICPTLLVYTNQHNEQAVGETIGHTLTQLRQELKCWEPESLVGRRLQVRWAKGKFYDGTVSAFDEQTGKHTVTYDDGDVRQYCLEKKTIKWV